MARWDLGNGASPVDRTLVLWRDQLWNLGNRDEKVRIWTPRAGWPRRNFSDKTTLPSQHSGQNDIISLACITTSEVCELALNSKVTRVRKITIVADDTSLCSTIFGSVSCILSRSTGLKFPIWTDNKIRRGSRANPGTVHRSQPSIFPIFTRSLNPRIESKWKMG